MKRKPADPERFDGLEPARFFQARAFERYADSLARYDPAERQRMLDLAAGARLGRIGTLSALRWRFEHAAEPLFEPLSEHQVADHRRAVRWLAECARRRGTEPLPCPCEGRYCP